MPTPPVEHRPATAGSPALEIHRSPRRRRSASAAPRDEVVVVRLPAGMRAVDEDRLIADLLRKVTGTARAAARGGDAELERRAAALADRYLDGIRASSVRWSGRMRRQHGSCTPSTGAIRISRELASAPGYVLDHVLVHELVHLRVPGHGPAFQSLLARYPDADRAIGWLQGYTAGRLAAASDAGSGSVDADRVGSDDDVVDPVDDGALS